MSPGDELLAAAQPLLMRWSTWTGRSWRHRVANRMSRGDCTFAAVSALADLAADTEQRPRRSVPRLDDSALLDQLSVMLHDVARTGDVTACQQAGTILNRLADVL